MKKVGEIKNKLYVMSRIKDLKNKDGNSLNIIELYKKLINSDKTKYVELFERLNNVHLNEFYPKNVVIDEIKSYAPHLDGDNLTDFEVIMLHSITQLTGSDRIIDFNKFVEYNERNLIEKNDVTTYKSFEELESQVNIVDIKLITKDMEKQVVTLFNDDEWVVIKPLSFEASKKYGSNTKWCTTMVTDPSYFFRYFRNGILIYCVNKKTGYKVAAYKKLSEREISFWNQQDKRIDSFESELTGEIIDILKKEFKNCKNSNYAVADYNEVRNEMKRYNVSYRDNIVEEAPRRGIPIGNAFDGEEDDGGHDAMEQPMEELMGQPDDVERLGEDIEIQPDDQFEEMGREEIMDILAVKSNVQVIDVDEDYLNQEIEIPQRGFGIRHQGNVEVEANHEQFAVTENPVRQKIWFIDTDDDLHQHDGRVEGTADLGGVGVEMAMAGQIREAIRENDGDWPENHGINVVG